MTSSTTLQIEERTLGDPDLDALVVAAVAELNRRYRVPGEPDDDYTLAQDAVCLVAFVDGVPAGCIAREAVTESGWEATAEMKRVFVHDDFRGRGVATALVAAYVGFHAEPTIEGTSVATTRAVVNASLLVLMFNFVLSAFLFR